MSSPDPEDGKKPSTLRPGPQIIREDEVIVRDVGKFPRKAAWWWLVLGHHLCDHNFSTLTAEDLERDVDPEGRCEPWFRRKLLWRNVPEELWRTPDNSMKGTKMAQPGLRPYDDANNENESPKRRTR